MFKKFFIPIFLLMPSISMAQSTYTSFKPLGGIDVSTEYNLGINDNVDKTLQDKFTDSVDVADFGVKCDAVLDTSTKTATGTDDTVAMQNAITYAANNGKSLHIHTGSCLISSTLTVPTGTSKSFYLDGEGSTILYTGSNSTISITEPTAVDDAHLKPYGITNLKFIVPADNYTNNTIAIDVQNNGMRGVTSNIFIKGYQTGIRYLNTASQIADNISIYSWGANNYGFYISGTWASDGSVKTVYNANNKIVRSTVIYGSGAYIGHAVQGTNFDHFSTLESQGWGIYADVASGDGTEALEIANSYIEAYNGGIYADSMSFSHIMSVNFDAPTSGIADTWYAIHAMNMFGGIIANNTVDGFGGSTVGTFIIGGDAIITGNNITGLTKSSSVPCMDLYPSSDSNTNMIVSNNKCWAAGGFNVSQNTGNILGTNNVWSGLANNTNTVVNFGTTYMNNGSVTGTLSSHSQNISGSTSTTKGNINLFLDSYLSFGATNSSGYGVVYMGNDTHGNLKVTDGGLALASVTMANLPTSCQAGTEYFVTDARNTGEATGAGTGAIAYCNSKAAWMVNGSAITN